jgi:hypothetical protein
MDRVKAQADTLRKMVLDPTTYRTYQTLGQTTWTILAETALLVWLVLCLSLVVFEWFWKFSVGSGRDFRHWFDNLQGSSDQIASETGKAILSAGKSGLDFTISKAKSQLGLPQDD